MSVAVWPFHTCGVPLLAPFSFAEDRRAGVVAMSGGRYEQRFRRDPRAFRTYSVTLRATTAQRAAIRAFFVARGYGADSFYVEDVSDDGDARVALGVAMGTSVALQTAFPIPSTGEAGGYWPINHALTVLYDDGVAITRTVDTDSRTLTASVAPAGSSVMTADIYFYRRVVLRGAPQWAPAQGDPGLWDCQMTWEEVPA